MKSYRQLFDLVNYRDFWHMEAEVRKFIDQIGPERIISFHDNDERKWRVVIWYWKGESL